MVTKLTSILKKLDPQDPFRIELTDQLLEKLWVETYVTEACYGAGWFPELGRFEPKFGSPYCSGLHLLAA